MKEKLVNIALVSAFYEERKNLLDTYYPFLLETFDSRSINTIQEISERIKSIYDIELPINSIKNLISRFREQFQVNKADRSNWSVEISKEGITELVNLKKNEEATERNLNSFYTAFQEYAKLHKIELERNIIKEGIEKFVLRNLLQISFDKQNSRKEYVTNESFDKIFIYFLSYINEESQDLQETFESIWKGFIIWNEFKKQNFNETDIKLKKNLDIYIDSNFAISLLELHNPILNQASSELFSLMKDTKNINIYILDVSIKEIYDLLDLYDFIKDSFSDIAVDSIFYFLKTKGYDAIKIERLKDNLSDELRKLGIKTITTKILSEKDQKNYAKIYDFLYEKRVERNEKKPIKLRKQESAIEKSSHHDASAILHVLKNKDKYARNFESTKSIFLTSSFNLFRNYRNLSKELEYFPSVILDTTLTNILYLKNPHKGSKLSPIQVIKTHCNYLIIDQNIWATYLTTINKLIDDKEITADDYTRLITKNQITQDYLLNATMTGINKEKVKSILVEIKQTQEELSEELVKKDSLVSDLNTKKSILEEELNKEKSKRRESEEKLKKLEEQDLKALGDKIEELEKKNRRNDYIMKNTNARMDPMSKQIFWVGIILILTIGIFSFSDALLDQNVINKLNIKNNLAWLIRGFGSFATFFLLNILTKFYKKDFWSYLKSKSAYRKQLEQFFAEEFDKEYN